MTDVARRAAIAFGAFVIAWLAVSLVANWLFGSGNILVWMIAAVIGVGVYVEVLRRDRRTESRGAAAVEEA
jgi:Flp pilus assembly protein TadB